MYELKPVAPERIREIREAHKLDKSKFARALGVHRDSIYAWEAGTKEAPLWFGLALRAFVDVLPPVK